MENLVIHRKKAIIIFALVFLGFIGFCADSVLPANCTACHASTSPKFPLLGAKKAFESSGHFKLGNSYYANGEGCQACHTHEGFIEKITKGSVDPESFVGNPSQPGCYTCHAPHEKGNFSLRTEAKVTLANGKVFDAGKGNLCANCHQARSDAQKTVKAMDAKSIFVFWGAHHGPEADLFAGTNAYEFPGKTYKSGVHTKIVKDSCVACHMALPQGRYGLSPEIGGHSFNIEGDVHGAQTLNLSACIKCHKDIKQTGTPPVFDKVAKADYDLDGTVEPFQAEVLGLLAYFVDSKGAAGYLQKLTPPMYNADGSWNFGQKEGQRTLDQVAALYNYKFILEDRSKGAHNPTYTLEILYDSLQALDGKFNVSKRP